MSFSSPARDLAPLALLAVLLAAPSAGAVGALAASAGPIALHVPDHGAPVLGSTAQSTNWAGWAVTGAKDSVSKATASWIVPKVQGKCPSTDRYSSFWVGIDGYSSSTVEQIGTDSDCQGGSAVYYAWYEFYPANSVLISGITVHPGNVMSASVTFASGKFTVKITDVNTSASFHKKGSVSAQRTSAEWIAEAPSTAKGVLPLNDFGTVQFGKDATGVTGTDTATVSGSSGTIGAFGTAVAIDMINNAGTAYKATTGALTPDGSSFNVTWVSAGP